MKSSTEKNDCDKLSIEEVHRGQDFFWEHIKHANETLLNRSNVFLISQTILFGSYSLIENSVSKATSAHTVTLLIMGIVLNITWGYTSYKIIFKTQLNAKSMLINKDSPYYFHAYVAGREKRKERNRSDPSHFFTQQEAEEVHPAPDAEP
ncbi:MAG: hypothetical protein WGN25_14255 [Candidatus Electrothrix sp. GW3-4]|uniref:hypothetical protein n=1 Tax=Candidatus Electrothrix sp. GW3-4 TaxID=3126740 RepID=UPI0030CB0788